MTEHSSIKLPTSFSFGDIRLQRIDYDSEMASPFVLVRFATRGIEADLGLRLDIDKMAFLDHFENQEIEGFCKEAAPRIVRFLRNSPYAIRGGQVAAHIKAEPFRLPQVWEQLAKGTQTYLWTCAKYLGSNSSFTFEELASRNMSSATLRAYHRNLYRTIRSEEAEDPFVRLSEQGLNRYTLVEEARNVIIDLALQSGLVKPRND